MNSLCKKSTDINKFYIRVRKRNINLESKSSTLEYINNRINKKLPSISTSNNNISNDKINFIKKYFSFIEGSNNFSFSDYHVKRNHKVTYIKSLREKVFNKVVVDLIAHLKKYIKNLYIKINLYQFFMNKLKLSTNSKNKYNKKFIYKKLDKHFEYINNNILTENITKNNNRILDISKIYFLKNKISSFIYQVNNTINYSSTKRKEKKGIYHKKLANNNSTQRNKSESIDKQELSSIKMIKKPLNVIQLRNFLKVNNHNTPRTFIKQKLNQKVLLYQKKNYVAKQKNGKLFLDSYDSCNIYSCRSVSKLNKKNNISNFICYYNNIINHKNKVKENSNELIFYLKIDSFVCHVFSIIRKYKIIYVKYFFTQLKLSKNKKQKFSINKLNYISNKNININIIKTKDNKFTKNKLNNNFIYEKLNYGSKNKSSQKLKKITSGRLLFDENEENKTKIDQYRLLYIQNIFKYFTGNDMGLIKKRFDLWKNNTKKIPLTENFYIKNFLDKNNKPKTTINKPKTKENIGEKIRFFTIFLIGYVFSLKKNDNADNNNNNNLI